MCEKGSAIIDVKEEQKKGEIIRREENNTVIYSLGQG